jgi:processive 1,2-diacylglycerol beta-glucosyltransferase
MQPDLCVATHFLPAEIIAWLIAKKKLSARHAIVVTDYDVHALWLCRTLDRYYVALEESAEYMARIGVPRDKVRVTGIPVDPLFAIPLDRSAARKHFGLDPEALTLLVSAGGEGVGPIEQLVRNLLAMQKPWQIVAIAGKSEKTQWRAAPLRRRLHHRNGSIHGCGGLAGWQSRGPDHLGGARAGFAYRAGRAYSRAGRT